MSYDLRMHPDIFRARLEAHLLRLELALRLSGAQSKDANKALRELCVFTERHGADLPIVSESPGAPS